MFRVKEGFERRTEAHEYVKELKDLLAKQGYLTVNDIYFHDAEYIDEGWKTLDYWVIREGKYWYVYLTEPTKF